MIRRLLLLVVAIAMTPIGFAKAVGVPVPQEVRSDRFRMTVDRRPADVAHAAANYAVASIELTGRALISITAPTDDYWAKGVEVQPWRFGIRPVVKGRTIFFSIAQPVKLSISRPGDHLAKAEMFFLFANAAEVNPPKKGDPGIRYYGPGIYHENIDVNSGDNVYLAPGAVVFGGINIWGSENVKVFGRGMVIYDGPQDPDHDEGWMHRRNWHVIVMDKARNVDIEGITCIVRSRTWMIQMLESRHVTFNNVKVIGGSPGNANQDGMDWLGGGDTLIRDSFIRAADDIFAAYGNWLGYGDAVIAVPGAEVSNITIENSVLSTSISNVVRISWPQKIFNSQNFTLRDSDVIHMGIGGCKVAFALFEIWADPDGTGNHSGYHFENIRMEDWYSLVQLRQQRPGIQNVSFKDIWALENPSMAPSEITGDISGVSFDNVKLAGRIAMSDSDIPLDVVAPAKPPTYQADKSSVKAVIAYQPYVIRPKQKVKFDASRSSSIAGRIVSFEWVFGDGTTQRGQAVSHAFPDDAGTLLDGSGRFRVLLKVTDDKGNIDWAYQPVIVATALQAAVVPDKTEPGIAFTYYEGADLPLSSLQTVSAKHSGSVNSLEDTVAQRDDNFAIAYDGYIEVPADGGYTFMLMSRDGGRLEIGSKDIATTPAPFAQVCGSVGNAVQQATGNVALKAGRHRLHLVYSKTAGDNAFALKWQGPGLPLSDVPASALSH